MRSMALGVRVLGLTLALTLLPSSVERSGVTRQNLCAAVAGSCQPELNSFCTMSGEVRFHEYGG